MFLSNSHGQPSRTLFLSASEENSKSQILSSSSLKTTFPVVFHSRAIKALKASFWILLSDIILPIRHRPFLSL
jgi:hypothetical protein